MLKRDATTEPGSADASMRVARNSLTLRERTTEVLRHAIIDHRLPPGTHLKERELCDMLGVSRTSVREALRHLESEHLITTVPHRGPIVVTLTVDDARDLYKVRSALEGLVGELFATHASDDEIAELCRFARLMAEENLFVMLAASGLLTQFGLQAVINMGVNLSLLPTKGMTLPFISYGGSSMLSLGLAMGMLLALTRQRPRLGVIA